jgi:hypothetical protein
MKWSADRQYPAWQKWVALGMALVVLFVEPLVNWVLRGG